MKNLEERQSYPGYGVTARAVFIGLLLLFFNTYFIMTNGIAYGRSFPTTVSIMFNVLISLTVLMMVNGMVKFLWPSFALKQGELLTIYVMLCLSSAIAGFDIMQTLVVMIPGGHWFATPENEWRELFWRYLPEWLTIRDVDSLKDWYKGESTLYIKDHITLWLRPALWWTLSLSAVIWVMLCLDVLLRRQWIEHERLSYPIVQLPLAMTSPGGEFFKSKTMWIGLGIAAFINLINGFNAIYPSVPAIPLRSMDIGRYFNEKPWNAIGGTPVYILPFAIGLGYLMPLEMSFSIWFFYLFWKAQRVMGSIFGLFSLPGFPYYGPQGFGAYLALAVFALVGGRRYFYQILKGVFKTQLDENREPMAYRWAVIGLLGGLGFLIIFSYRAGMTLWMALAYFAVYYLLAISISRIRAEVGPPTHELALTTPRRFLVQILGSRHISTANLSIMTLYISFHRYYRSLPMPHTLEGFKIAAEAKINSRRLIWVMMLTTVVGILVAFWAYVSVSYRFGGDPYEMSRVYGFDALQNWLNFPSETDTYATGFTIGAFLFTGLLWWLRRVFPFWPLHPAGYAIATSTWTMGMLWFSIFISWLVKNTILRFGGIRLYRKVFPFFLGLFLGDYLVGGGWVLIGVFFNMNVYSFYR